jgi:dTDP-glucose 4,6-dehydratase
LVDALVARSDVVVHMAAESDVGRSIEGNGNFFETDILGTQCVANAVVKHVDSIDRFIHVSTSEVYGAALRDVIDEDHPLNPMSPYASAKCGADRLVFSYWKTYNIPSVIVRPFNIFGPSQHVEKAVPKFITSCLLGQPITVHGDGSAERDWLYVDDHCDALDRLIHVDREDVVGEVLNVGSGTHLSILAIAEAVQKAMQPRGSDIQLICDRPGQVSSSTADISKAKRLIGWTPHVPFSAAMECTTTWYQQHEAWWRGQMSVDVNRTFDCEEKHS